jgi:hypothetical protein
MERVCRDALLRVPSGHVRALQVGYTWQRQLCVLDKADPAPLPRCCCRCSVDRRWCMVWAG